MNCIFENLNLDEITLSLRFPLKGFGVEGLELMV